MSESELTRKDQLNHQAFHDVMENRGPSLPDDEDYMQCYRSWYDISPYKDLNEY